MPASDHDQNSAELTTMVLCPRCGYDQQGTIESWIDSCPLTMTCVECGLEFESRSALVEESRFVPWLVECSPVSLTWLASCLKTIGHAMTPWSFWKQIPLGVRWKPSRILLANLCLLLVAGVTLMLSYSIAVLNAYSAANTQVTTGVGSNLFEFRLTRALVDTDVEQVRQLYIEEYGAAFEDDDYFRDRYEAGRESVVGAWPQYIANVRMSLAAYEQNGAALEESSLEILGTAFSAPLSSRPFFTTDPILFPEVARLSPRQTWDTMFDSIVGFYKEDFIAFLCFMMCGSLVMPTLIWGLPVSRRRAKVLPRHVLRAAGYGFLGIGLTLWALCILSAVKEASDGRLLGNAIQIVIVRSLMAWSAWCLLWWYFAVRRYMRIPHALLIVIAGGILSILTFIVGEYYLFEVIGL